MPVSEVTALAPLETIVDKPWGHERWLAVYPGLYAFKLIHVNAGESLSLQRHAQKHETQFYISGTARIEHGTDLENMLVEEIIGSGALTTESAITFEPGRWHRITAVSDVEFAEVQTAHPGWDHDIERREDRYGRAGTTAPA